VEVSEDSEYLEVSFEASGDWTLVTTEFWVGDNITSVPYDEGDLDTESFPYFWCNSTGESSYKSKVDLKWKYVCEEQSEFTLAVVAQVTMAQMDSDGQIVEGTELITFATEYEVEANDGLFGWFDVPILCECVELDPLTASEGIGEAQDSQTECSGETVTSKDVIAIADAATLSEASPTASASSVEVPMDADKIVVVFELEEIGSWATDDKFVLTVSGSEIDMGALENYDHRENPTNSASGTVGDISWSRHRVVGAGDSGGKLHSVEITIPGSRFADAASMELLFGLDIETFADQVANVSDLAVTAHGSWCETRRLEYASADKSCKKDIQVAVEDFETGTAASWSNGLIALDDKFGHFLGRLGLENPTVSKVFAIPTESDSVVVQFSLYTIGTSAWKSSDQFHVRVGIADINMGDFTKQASNGSSQDITWSRTAVDSDNHHRISLEITREYYLTGKLTLAFEVATRESIARKSAGVDNLIITARGVDSCGDAPAELLASASGFRVGSMTAAEPDMDGEDEEGRGYCRSEDFPCGDQDGMVYVCHYSITSGYQTFCLKESDSDLVRTYPDDYCGPCVGGYGSMNKQTAP